MTQREVAEQAGVSLRAYQMFENGQATPQQKNLEAILRVFPVEVEDLDLEHAREHTIEGWPPDVKVFGDFAQGILATMPEPDRAEAIHELTLQLLSMRLGPVTQKD
jgi:transcriptional regulator with XRE-family HTH domain